MAVVVDFPWVPQIEMVRFVEDRTKRWKYDFWRIPFFCHFSLRVFFWNRLWIDYLAGIFWDVFCTDVLRKSLLLLVPNQREGLSLHNRNQLTETPRERKIACEALIPIPPIPIKCAFIMRKMFSKFLSPETEEYERLFHSFRELLQFLHSPLEKYFRTIACACISGVLEYQQEVYSFQYWVLFLDQHERESIHQTYLLEFLLMKHSFGSDQ